MGMRRNAFGLAAILMGSVKGLRIDIDGETDVAL
ncbi:hypothetical protein TA5114_02342 [Cognatishimia activa]|uniref:Uncharacterized protein n=1 Tax=Cognatishimia activa TaxID=1715691 RepID=A0A0P1JA99_9RHOB|nr:hypothetical protein TA5113_01169 [Cognatishimia activa]CUK26527.1 hypothetical protein TA5114_02342 [Cognatishimia activa]